MHLGFWDISSTILIVTTIPFIPCHSTTVDMTWHFSEPLLAQGLLSTSNHTGLAGDAVIFSRGSVTSHVVWCSFLLIEMLMDKNHLHVGTGLPMKAPRRGLNRWQALTAGNEAALLIPLLMSKTMM